MSSSQSDTPQTATSTSTVKAIAESAKRSDFPIRRSFIQEKSGESNAGPLASFVTSHDKTGLLLYFLALTKASSEPWDVSLHSKVWARALDLESLTEATARSRVSKAWSRLVNRQLVRRGGRRKRNMVYLLQREDGSGEPYTRPTSHFVKVPHTLWTEGPTKEGRWFQVLELPGLTFLLIALSNRDSFKLPVERGPDFYGISADTLWRGYRELEAHKLLSVSKELVEAPLTPNGFTQQNIFRLQGSFQQQTGKQANN